MLSRRELLTLIERQPAPDSPVLSVYLGVDQSHAANLNRGFETTLRNLLRTIDEAIEEKPRRHHFTADAGRVTRHVAAHTPGASTLVMFCDESAGFFRAEPVRATLPDAALWAEAPYLRPLLEALDDFERYGVIVADRARERLFTVFMGEIEEHTASLAPAGVHPPKTTGRDHLWSQKQFQRRADVHAGWHLKMVAERTTHLADLHGFDRLVLAGPREVTAALRRLLPKRLRSRVSGDLALPVEATHPEILQAVERLAAGVDRHEEARVVEELLNARGRSHGPVLGLDVVLAPLQEGRVWQFVYAAGVKAQGWECPKCFSLFADTRSVCGYCGALVRPVDDLVERVTERVLDAGGTVERVRGEAAERLTAEGGVGAYLRY